MQKQNSSVPPLAREHQQRVTVALELLVQKPSTFATCCVYFSLLLNVSLAYWCLKPSGLFSGVNNSNWVLPQLFCQLGLNNARIGIPLSVITGFLTYGYAARSHYTRRNCAKNKLQQRFWEIFKYSHTDVLILAPVHFLVICTLFSSEWRSLFYSIPLSMLLIAVFLLLFLLTISQTRQFVLITFNLIIILPHYFYKITGYVTGLQFVSYKDVIFIYYLAMLVVVCAILISTFIVWVMYGRITYLTELVYFGHYQFILFFLTVIFMLVQLSSLTFVLDFFASCLIFGYGAFFLFYFICYFYSAYRYKQLLYYRSQELSNYLDVCFEEKVTRQSLAKSFKQWREPSVFVGRKFNLTATNNFFKRMRRNLIIYPIMFTMIDLYKYFF